MAAGLIKKHELKANSWDIESFLNRVVEGAEDECWIWQGYKVSEGYGKISRKKDGKSVTIFVHRLMYTIHNGEIPDDYVIDHLCRVRDCINPKHLEAVTHEENVKRGVHRGGGTPPPAETRLFRREKRGACRKGHHWTEENMITRKSGRVDCLPCRRIHNLINNSKVVTS